MPLKWTKSRPVAFALSTNHSPGPSGSGLGEDPALRSAAQLITSIETSRMATLFIFWHHKRNREAHKTMRSLIQLTFLLAVQTVGVSLFPWAKGVEVGLLDPVINEASGLAVSARYRDRLYHVNDSGDRGRFFIT